MIKKITTALCVLGGLAAGSTTMAAPIVLDFEGIAPHPNGNNVFVQDFYNGGTASNGSSGTNFGIEFSSNSLAICLNTETVNCSNTSRGGLGNPDSQLGGLFFLTGAASIMNVAAGFDTGFSFFYSAAFQSGSVEVYDDLDGTGNLLATLDLPTNGGSCAGFGAAFCPFLPVGVAFDGTAKSVSFAGVANQIAFDDITFGSVIPDPEDPEPPVDPIPLPASLPLLLAALGGTGALLRKKKKS